MWSIDTLQKAWYLASKLHYGQQYGGHATGEQIEYISHIGSVTFEILGVSFIEPEIDVNLATTCAVLHDTLEDTDLHYDDILATFGLPVAEGVKALTKNSSIVDNQAMMIDSLNRIKQQPREIAMVKMADRICNLYTPPYYWNKTRRIEYQREAILVLKELKESSKHLSQRLEQKIQDYNKYIF